MNNGDLIKFKNECVIWTTSRNKFLYLPVGVAIIINNDYMDTFEYELQQYIIFYNNKFWIVQAVYTEAVKI